MALYIPHSIFPLGAAFVCQAGNFWTLLRILLDYTYIARWYTVHTISRLPLFHDEDKLVTYRYLQQDPPCRHKGGCSLKYSIYFHIQVLWGLIFCILPGECVGQTSIPSPYSRHKECNTIFSNFVSIRHLGTGFAWFPCVYKPMLRWFPTLQVATACF